jgi:Fe-S oxidoreductase
MRDVLEMSAIDHVYYRSYDPLVRCIGREYTPNRSSQIAMLVAGGRLTWTPDVVQAMYWSFNSRINRVWNRDNSSEFFDQDEGDWDRPARADIVDAGATPPFVKTVEENVKKFGNIYGVKDEAGPVGKAAVLYIVDDTTRAKTPEIAAAVKKVLTAKGVDFTVLAKGTDGWGLYDLGLWNLAEEKAKEFAGFIKDSGAKTVVANSPAVVYALREWYPKLGLALDAEVLHHSEYFKKLGVGGKFSGKVTFHDSSYLGRYLGVFDAPRDLLNNVADLELAECYFTKEKANPTGPLFVYFDDEWAQMVAARRAGELALAAPTVVTADPASKRNLNPVAQAAGIKVLDIAELLA